jgi:hypothetical protein
VGKSSQCTAANIIILLFMINPTIVTQTVAANEWHRLTLVPEGEPRLNPLFGGGDCSASWLLMPSARARISIDVWKNIIDGAPAARFMEDLYMEIEGAKCLQYVSHVD